RIRVSSSKSKSSRSYRDSPCWYPSGVHSVIDKKFERRLAGLVNCGERGVLRGGRKGVEKESLRVSPAGEIARTRHPAALGAPLTNEHITTDFSEALIELVTPPFRETWELLQYLCDIHQ